MSLEKINHSGTYLDYKSLSPKNHIRRIAKLHSFNLKTNPDTHSNYVILHLRDKNQVSVMATIWDVEDLNDASVQLKPLKNNIIEITGLVGIFGEKYTIRVSKLEDIVPYYDEEADKVFSRKIDNVQELSEEIISVYSQLGLNVSHDIMWEFTSIESVYDGKSGGLVKLMNDIVRASTSYVTAPGIDSALFMKCLYVSLETLAFKLDAESKLGFTDNFTLFTKVNGYSANPLFDKVTFPVAFDCMCGIIGLAQSVHPYSIIIKKLIDNALEVQQFVVSIPSLVIGDTVTVGGTRLSAF